jgi:ABC-2 type transport system ATP-binding protein
MILDLLAPDAGDVLWQGSTDPVPREQVGFLPEERGLYPKLSIEKQLHLFAALKGLKKAESRSRIDHWLEYFALTDRRKHKADTLSKGNQQKVQLIISFIHQPKLLILDEPFSGLDPVNADLLKSCIFDLKKQGTTILFSSHRMDHVEELCDSICLLKEGRSLYAGDLMTLKRSFGRLNLVLDKYMPAEEAAALPGVVSCRETAEELILRLTDEAAGRPLFEQLYRTYGYLPKFSLDYLSMDTIFKKLVEEDDAAAVQVTEAKK